MSLSEIQIKRRLSFAILGINSRGVQVVKTDPSSATLVSGEDIFDAALKLKRDYPEVVRVVIDIAI